MIRNSILVFFILASFDTLGQYVAETKNKLFLKKKQNGYLFIQKLLALYQQNQPMVQRGYV